MYISEIYRNHYMDLIFLLTNIIMKISNTCTCTVGAADIGRPPDRAGYCEESDAVERLQHQPAEGAKEQ